MMMQTMIEILKKTEAYFLSKGVVSPRLNAELILAHVLNLKRLDVYLSHDRPLTEEELDRLRIAVRRRGNREPIQYIEGNTEFYNCSLNVDARCLIPRPETEELVGWISDSLTDSPKQILDLGSGSGAIAIALAILYKDSRVVAVDSSRDAIALIQENIKLNGLGDRVEPLHSSWYQAVHGKYDLIVSNPPYLTVEELETAEPEVRNYEPNAALVSDEDGFKDIALILEDAQKFLNVGGSLFLETGIGHAERLMSFPNRFLSKRICKKDLSGRHRFFSAEFSSMNQ